MIRSAIERMREFGRRMVIGGHIGRFPAAVLDNAIHYLDRLQETVVGIRADATAQEADVRIASIPIEACLAPRVDPTGFEREWHQHNLQVVVAQSIFTLEATIAARASLHDLESPCPRGDNLTPAAQFSSALAAGSFRR